MPRWKDTQTPALFGDDPTGRGSGWRSKPTRGWDRKMMERMGVTLEEWRAAHARELQWLRAFRARVRSQIMPNPYEPREPREYGLEGLKRREEGMARVSRHTPAEWQERVLAVIREIAAEVEEFTQSRVRFRCRRIGVPDPSNPNAWGPVFRMARSLGIMEKAGRTTVSTYPPETHGRQVPVYRSKAGP